MLNYIELAKKVQADLIEDLQGWIKIPSVYNATTSSKTEPFGKEVANALSYIATKAERDGFNVDKCDGYCTEITYGDQEEMVLILGHTDVVPAGRGWSNDPFTPVIKDGKMYGRGTSDDKGPTMAAYYALKIIKDLNLPLKRKIRLVVGGNEESGSRCLDHYFDVLKKPHGQYGFSPDADFPLIYAEKGIMTYIYSGETNDDYVISFEAGVASNSVPDYAKAVIKGKYELADKISAYANANKITGSSHFEGDQTVIEFNGKSAHGGSPQLGNNAASHLMSFIAMNFDSKLFKHFAPLLKDYDGTGLGIKYRDEEMGPVSMNLGIATYKEGKYSFVLNIRYPKTTNGENITKQVNIHILHEGKCVSDSYPLYVSPSSTLVKTLLAAYQEVSGDMESKPYTISGGTYARHTTNSVAFGMAFPKEDNKIHQEDEFVILDSLTKGTAIYLKALIDLASI
jgi:succinyl-diaminopimelate desuccinylase